MPMPMIELEHCQAKQKIRKPNKYVRALAQRTVLVSWDHHFAAVKSLHYECQRTLVD
jgi:hypothetical protein